MERFPPIPGLWVHAATLCDPSEPCVIHRPSDHHMRDWPLHWRDDRKLMERLCAHGIGHPDPDDIAFKRRALGDRRADAEAVHGCDGCCAHTMEPNAST